MDKNKVRGRIALGVTFTHLTINMPPRVHPFTEMVLFDNSLIRLYYVAASDILAVGYSDLHDSLLTNIKRSLDMLVDTAKNYDIKRLLLDSIRTVTTVCEEAGEPLEISLDSWPTWNLFIYTN